VASGDFVFIRLVQYTHLPDPVLGKVIPLRMASPRCYRYQYLESPDDSIGLRIIARGILIPQISARIIVDMQDAGRRRGESDMTCWLCQDDCSLNFDCARFPITLDLGGS
jgi:hypothetical protein